jgi:zinc transport system ATP-binding protein
MSDQAILEIQNLSYAYSPSNYVFESANFIIKKGEFAGLVGENGSGKSTMLKLITGSLQIQSGQIKLFGQQRQDFDQFDKVGYIPQQISFDTNFPTNVEEMLGFYGYDKANPQHQEILDRLGLFSLFKRSLNQLSGGQRQRVYITLSLFTGPQLLLLDEPTVGVDNHYQNEFYEFLKYLNTDKNIAILLVSHDTDVLDYYAQTIYCLGRFELHNLGPSPSHKKIKHIHKI